MEKITFVIPSRNNLEFLKLAYRSIRNLSMVETGSHSPPAGGLAHDILILDDASTDGTQEWINSLNDKDLITYHNPGPERIGIVGMFDKGIEMARTDIIFAFHADMVAGPNLDEHVLKHLKRGTVVSATRVEPPLHPDGPEKMLVDFGVEVEDFDINKFNYWVNNGYKPKHDTLVTEGIFAPWCMYKDDFLAIGGHDELFAPQSKEDSDLFNRFVLNDYKVLQTWEGLVYHFTSRGSRFNKHAGGAAGKNSEEWIYTTNKNMRNFIRKWGQPVKHDPLMKPIIPSKYNICFKVKNSTLDFLNALEPWCDVYYGDGEWFIYDHYIKKEQTSTTIDLKEKIKPLDDNLYNYNYGVVIDIDQSNFTKEDFHMIQLLPEILDESGEIGEFELGHLKIKINNLETTEHILIQCK
jgi:glycosyltransferase involved in cell wall biosynthesis